MTFFIVGLVVVAGWFGYRWIKKKAARARGAVDELSVEDVRRVEAHLDRDKLAAMRTAAAKKAADVWMRDLEAYYFHKEMSQYDK